jgi:hypothetical protein
MSTQTESDGSLKMIDKAKIKVKVQNPAAVLLDEDGVFELTSPWGDVFRVTCHRGVGMAFTQVDEVGRRTRYGTRWRIRRHRSAVSDCIGQA